MKFSIKLISLALVLAMIFALCACGANTDGPAEPGETTTESDEREVKTKVAALYGPTGMGLAKLKEDRAYGYEVEYYSDPQEIVPLLVQGTVDIAALPINLAANLYKKTEGGIQILAVNTLGILHVLQKGEKTVKSIADLKGRTIYTSGEGTTAQYTLEYVLRQNGIEPGKDVELVYMSTHGELATKAASGDINLCILPEPFASKVIASTNPKIQQTNIGDLLSSLAEEQSSDEETGETAAEATTGETETTIDPEIEFPPENRWKKALDITEEWNKISDAQLAFGCVVARKEYIDANPDIISEFMTFNEVSVNWVNSAVDAPYLLVEQGFFTDKDAAELAIPGCNIVFIEGEEMKTAVQANFEILFAASPESVGGSVPDEGIYYPG